MTATNTTETANATAAEAAETPAGEGALDGATRLVCDLVTTPGWR